MSGLGFAALLIGRLLPPDRRRMERALERQDATLLRLGLVLAVELVLFAGLTLLVMLG
jgi:hypothetical protein